MDANELANVAYDAMSKIDLTAHDRGQIYGVLQMALRTLEAQHAALLAEADEETAEAKKLWREALAELDALKVDRNTLIAINNALLNAEVRKLNEQCDFMAAEIDAKQRELDALQAENARLHRSLEERMSARIPGAVQVARTDELHGMAKVHLVPAGSEEL